MNRVNTKKSTKKARVEITEDFDAITLPEPDDVGIQLVDLGPFEPKQ
jgi:hypothetical protein